MKKLNVQLKEAREKKAMLIRELAAQMGIDQALISKFEKGVRKPTRSQIGQLASILNISEEKLLIVWLSEKIVYELNDEPDALQVLMLAEEQIKLKAKEAVKKSDSISTILKEIDTIKKRLTTLRKFDSYRIAQALEIEYTFESNRIEGNTLTLQETDLVVNEGITISGKSMREHLEAINHKEAIELIKELVEKKSVLTERTLLSIHHLVLRGIDPQNAGKYRSVQVMIKGSKHMPPQPFIVPKQMEDYFLWYNRNRKKLHPILLAAEMHERLVTIHPFIDGNGRTSRLVMNLILLQHGYVIANIKGEIQSRIEYYSALEKVQVENDKSHFIKLIAEVELQSITRYVDILEGK
jgi:Fic family protein/DNA-binding Xre family transcriptional regulator